MKNAFFALKPPVLGPARDAVGEGPFRVESLRVVNPRNGAEQDFLRVRLPHCVCALALNKAGEMVMVRQFRVGTGSFSVEFPGGCLEPGEDVIEAAARELREETGYVPLVPGVVIGETDLSPAITNSVCTFVLFESAERQAAMRPDEMEDLAVATFPVAELYAMVHNGTIRHAAILAGLFFFQAGGTEHAGVRP